MALHTGSCQCGATRFEVEVALDKPVTCNCSRCRRLGAVMVFAPRAAFRFTAEGPLTEYLFNTGKIHHRFCSVCGIEPFAEADAPDGTPTIMINVNCLDGVDARALGATAFAYDGASV